MSRHIVPLAIVLGMAVQSFASASAERQLAVGNADVVHLKLSDLRSAYLLRDGVVHYDAATNSSQSVKAQLQRHFNTVIGLLLISTPRSIETALARLEAADDHQWTDADRGQWRKSLLSARYRQLQRLAYYRDRGQFPLNEGQSVEPIPIFVDDHGTACAVGQLMCWSGWHEEVAEIQQNENLVYVPDALASSITSWTLTSGITQEEAALIQPGYPFDSPFLINDFGPGGQSLVRGGLKYENLRIAAQNFVAGPFLPSVGFHQAVSSGSLSLFDPVSTGALPTLQTIGFNAGSDVIPASFGQSEDPPGNRWMTVGGWDGIYPNTIDRALHAKAQQNAYQLVVLDFDVSTVDAGAYITQFSEHSYFFHQGFLSTYFPGLGIQYDAITTASFAGMSLSTPRIQEPSSFDFVDQHAVANLATPASNLHVTTTMWLYNGANIDSITLGFNLVPEPSSTLAAIFGFVAIALRRPVWTRR